MGRDVEALPQIFVLPAFLFTDCRRMLLLCLKADLDSGICIPVVSFSFSHMLSNYTYPATLYSSNGSVRGLDEHHNGRSHWCH